eukprot:TRINITY_DN8904_c0_g1_i6.p4 TRINITY_DN8904_c0_g1~~TRINITY_DN8904_c0_g1_i6.p4  ORF type:complete len:116 (-),score=56.06 TRINITY_DN8904_c0_g1_i6:163-510(-)
MLFFFFIIIFFFFFFSSRRRHTRCREVSWARRCVQETGINAEYMGTGLDFHPVPFWKKNRSLSPKGKDAQFFRTTAAFPKKYEAQMKAVHNYQKEMDKRLSQPKTKKVLPKKIFQ